VRPFISWDIISEFWSVETKNTWARDDPAILVLISGAIICASIIYIFRSFPHDRPLVVSLLWSLVYSLPFLSAIRLSILMITRDFFLSSIITATLLYYFSNTVLLAPPSHASADSTRVEWGYTFDVAINSFFPCFLTLGVAQLLLVSIITRSSWICLWAGNTLYLLA